MTNTREPYREYWEKNIEQWGQLYLDISHGHETFKGPAALNYIYNHTLVPVEAALMKKRYAITMDFIRANVRAGTIFGDIGCGVGIFTVEALKLGATVKAIDFSSSALDATKSLVKKLVPEHMDRVTFHRCDVRHDVLPKTDVAIMMGVLPYLKDLDGPMNTVLSSTGKILLQYVDPRSPFNAIRIALPILNVRNLNFHAPKQFDSIASSVGYRVTSRKRFATGYVDIIERKLSKS